MRFRTVLDVLDAEEELYRAEVGLLRARRDQVLASYRLRAAAGRLTAEELGLPVQVYDPGTHPRFNWSSQRLSAPTAAPHQGPRLAFSSRASCAACR
jgi:hypothetical protein